MESKVRRIGVFICGCGPNIANTLDIEKLKDFASSLDGVILALTHKTLCANTGREFIKEKVRETKLTHLVICACSPHEHEITFRQTAKEAGLNPYLIQVADIREGVAWVTPDRDEAFEKARVYLLAAVERVKVHEPLTPVKIEFCPDVLVVGAGVAGISAALTLASAGRRVYLVEKEPCIGGMAAKLDRVFQDLRCASSLLEERLNDVLNNKNIELLTLAKVTKVLGFFGNFYVQIHKKATFVDGTKCLGCGTCQQICKQEAISLPFPGALPYIAVLNKDKCLHFKGEDCQECLSACPFGAIELDQQDKTIERRIGAVIIATGFKPYGYIESPEVITSFEFEQILKEGILEKSKTLKEIALIHCLREDYCSLVCCPTLIKFSRLIKERLPEAEVFHLYRRLYLPDEESYRFYKEAREGVYFIEVEEQIPTVFEEEGRLIIKGGAITLAVDMVVTGCGMKPFEGTEEVAELFGIEVGENGFLTSQDKILSPSLTPAKGVFVAGCISGPKDIPSSITQAEAAAAEILSIAPKGEVELEATIAWIDPRLCGGCKICLSVCPYQAISFDQIEGICRVEEILCQGCGSCAGACPSGAITAQHFTYEQISREIAGIFK